MRSPASRAVSPGSTLGKKRFIVTSYPCGPVIRTVKEKDTDLCDGLGMWTAV